MNLQGGIIAYVFAFHFLHQEDSLFLPLSYLYSIMMKQINRHDGLYILPWWYIIIFPVKQMEDNDKDDDSSIFLQ
jgi:hypothetical protein